MTKPPNNSLRYEAYEPPVNRKAERNKREKHIKHLIRVLLVLTMSYVLINEPPKTSSAANIDNPEEPTVQVATPQAVSEPKKPQPAKEKARLAKATAPKPKPVSYPQGCENYVQLIQQYFGNYAHIAVKVAQAESGCNPLAVGDDYPINGLYAPSCGLFQIRTLQGRPSCEQLKNPETNVQWAHKLFLSSGWQPWTVCNHGIVSCY